MFTEVLSQARSPEIDSIHDPLFTIISHPAMQESIRTREIGLIVADLGSGKRFTDAFAQVVHRAYSEQVGQLAPIPMFGILGRKNLDEVIHMQEEFRSLQEAHVNYQNFDPTRQKAAWVTDQLDTLRTAERMAEVFQGEGIDFMVVSHSATPGFVERSQRGDLPALLKYTPIFYGRAGGDPSFARRPDLSGYITHSKSIDDRDKLAHPQVLFGKSVESARRQAFDVGDSVFRKVLRRGR